MKIFITKTLIVIAFIIAVAMDALIIVGILSTYGHPNPDAITMWNSNGCAYAVTTTVRVVRTPNVDKPSCKNKIDISSK